MRGSWSHRDSQGREKKAYMSHSSARSSMKRIQKTTPMLVVIYRCLECRLWHVGKSKYQLYEVYWRERRNDSDWERLSGRLVGALSNLLRSRGSS